MSKESRKTLPINETARAELRREETNTSNKIILETLAGMLLIPIPGWAIFTDRDPYILTGLLVFMGTIFMIGPFLHYLSWRKNPDCNYEATVTGR